MPTNSGGATCPQPVCEYDSVPGISDRAQAKTRSTAGLTIRHVEVLGRRVGRVMQALRDCGQYDNTLVFFLSDNGGTRGMPGPNNAPLRSFKRPLWEGGLRIPSYRVMARTTGRRPRLGERQMTDDSIPSVEQLSQLFGNS